MRQRASRCHGASAKASCSCTRCKEGPASRSYGLQVAQLAGVPREVIAQARRYLEALESQRDRMTAPAEAAGAHRKPSFRCSRPTPRT